MFFNDISNYTSIIKQINQIYYWRSKSKTDRHYNCFQRQLKWKLYIKVIKMPSWKAWVQRPSGQIKMEGSVSRKVGRDANIAYVS